MDINESVISESYSKTLKVSLFIEMLNGSTI